MVFTKQNFLSKFDDQVKAMKYLFAQTNIDNNKVYCTFYAQPRIKTSYIFFRFFYHCKLQLPTERYQQTKSTTADMLFRDRL